MQRLALGRERIEGGVVLAHPRAIDLAHDRGSSIRSPERLQVVHVEEQPPVAGTAHLVELREPRLDVGQLRCRGLGERRRSRFCRIELPLHVGAVALDARQLFDADLPLDLELAQIHQHRTFLRGQRVRLALQRAQTIVGPLRSGRSAIAILRQRGLRYQRGDRDGDEQVQTGVDSAFRRKIDAPGLPKGGSHAGSLPEGGSHPSYPLRRPACHLSPLEYSRRST
jgi:hypothetical protein